MRTLALSAALAGAATLLGAQPYQPTWESIDRRATPAWFTDAKFGIFIHWGVYSVPSYAPVVPGRLAYAEWYWNALTNGRTPKANPVEAGTWEYHRQRYGEDHDYPSFAPQFRAELFDPGHWADVFRRSGAKYVVLTSKHHEGFALWPSREASAIWGRPWNAVEIGPRRDVLGELTQAVRSRGLRMGYYYSLYEWYNPVWLADRPRYVREHVFPQFKDLVERYQPALLFADGEWDLPSAEWRSPELLAWLFNESKVKDEVVVNDRWGKDTRHRHGGYWTTEYTPGMSGAAHPWEENRGMGFSYGYNRAERLDHYRSGRELVTILADTVSRGGNLLLDIGPDADGTIPVIMEQRLAEIGSWLGVNGEAIYGTRPFAVSKQWSAGEVPKIDYGQEYNAEYDIGKLTAKPAPGRASIEAFFTQKGAAVYAILPRWPGRRFTLRGEAAAAPVETVRLLGAPGTLRFSRTAGALEVELPELPEELLGQPAWVLELARAAGAAVAGAGAAGASAALAPPVRTSGGLVQGRAEAGGAVRAYLGIPFAAAPTGERRWREPGPAPSWQGVRQAVEFGARCLQGRIFDDMIFRDRPSEDCLFLNVWTPARRAGERLPVMVWIHGGGFQAGSASEPRQDGTRLAQKGVVVVGVNYRLGVFGFLAHPQLGAESGHGGSGNYGLLDQLAALRWVRDNAAAFGGDPGKVTIFGESAGSFAVSALLASPLAKGLVHRAIGESGAYVGRHALPPATLAAREQAGVAFAKSLGADSLPALRAKPAEELLQAALKTQPWFAPGIDGHLLPKDPTEIYAAGAQLTVPLLAGWNADEVRGGVVLGPRRPTAASFTEQVGARFGPARDEVLRVYPASSDAEAVESAAALAGDTFLGYATWKWIELQRQAGAPVFRYSFDRKIPLAPGTKVNGVEATAADVGARHAGEIEYVFGALDSQPKVPWEPADRALSELMMSYWANFARAGDPNGRGLPPWPRYTGKDGPQVMHLDAKSEARPDTRRERYSTLDRVMNAAPPPKASRD